MHLPAALARRFVAGETAQTAIAAGVVLEKRGIHTTFDLLGEDVTESEAAKRAADANISLLRAIPKHVERNVSVKLTVLGLDISESLCLELTSRILEAAKDVDGFVRIDMEGSKHTQRTIDAFQALRKTYDNVGIVLQAYLHRTFDDVQDAVKRGDRVRLCKGAYKEPENLAFQKMDDVRAHYRKCADLLLEKANYPAMATHDEGLVKHVLDHVSQEKIEAKRFEFQMLYGLRPKRWDELVAAGYNVRVYVPYGTHWFPYFSRRLRERPENVMFVLKSLVTG
jgi:proline dehydrogenase